MNLKKRLLIGLILTVALLFRLYGLDLYPPSLNWDEVSHGYNAYSILNTGRDEWGHFLPSIFRAFGDYKLPVYIYLTVPMVKLFGLTAYGVRMVSALAGSLSTLYIYLISKELFGRSDRLAKRNKTILNLVQDDAAPILAALAMAVSPWMTFLSRVAVEANLAAFFIISGGYYFLLGVRQKRNGRGKAWGFALSGLLWGLSLFTYNAARVFVPLLIILLVWIYKKLLINEKTKIRKNKNTNSCVCHLVGLSFFLLFFTGMVYQFVLPEGQARLSNISVLDQGTINRINEARGDSELPDPFPRLFYNKGTFLIGRSIQGYASYFNPRFWFVDGGDHYQFGIPGFPLVYPINGILILLGIWGIWEWRKDKLFRESLFFIVGWILLAPIAAAPTRDNPHALRIVTMMPIPYLLIGIGIQYLVLSIKYKVFKIVGLIGYILVIGWSFRSFWTEYTGNYRLNYAWAWQDGYEEMVESVKKSYAEYDRIFITKEYGEPHEFILFYWPWDPSDYVEKKKWDYHADWYWVNGFDKFVFFNDWEVENVKCQMSNVKCLLIASNSDALEGWVKLDTIYNINQEKVFEIYEN